MTETKRQTRSLKRDYRRSNAKSLKEFARKTPIGRAWIQRKK